MEDFRILIVDNAKDLVLHYIEVFRNKGYICEYDYTPAGAIKKCQENFYDLVLIDIKLPNMSGLELASRLEEISPETECVIMGGYGSMEDAINAVRQRSVISYEKKPVDMTNLLDIVTKTIERKQNGNNNTSLKEDIKDLKKDFKEVTEKMSLKLDGVHDGFLFHKGLHKATDKWTKIFGTMGGMIGGFIAGFFKIGKPTL